MKKLLSILMCISLLSVTLYSCGSDDDDDGDITTRPVIDVTVKASYATPGGVNSPDKGSIVYLFEGFDRNNGGRWEYKGSGVFSSSEWGTNWGYTKKAIIGEDGSIKIESVQSIQGEINEYNFFTIVIESNAHKDDVAPYYAINLFTIAKKNLILSYQYGGAITMKYE